VARTFLSAKVRTARKAEERPGSLERQDGIAQQTVLRLQKAKRCRPNVRFGHYGSAAAAKLKLASA